MYNHLHWDIDIHVIWSMGGPSFIQGYSKGIRLNTHQILQKKNEYVHYVFCMYACKLDFGTKLKGIPALSVKMD